MRLAEETRRSAVPEMSQYMNGVKLDNKQYVEIKKYSRKEQEINGKTFIETIGDLLDAPEYKELIDDDKLQQIRTITIKFDEAAKAKARISDVKLYNKTIQKDLTRPAKYEAQRKGISEEEALIELRERYEK